MKKLLILKTGTTFPGTFAQWGDFDDWTFSCLDVTPDRVMVVNAQTGTLPVISECAGIILTGSHDMVTDSHPWSLAIEAWLPDAITHAVPILGICYGHQLLGRVMGGEAGYHPKGLETGTVQITLTENALTDPLFHSIARLQPIIKVHATHSQTLLRSATDTVILANNEHDSYHAVRYGNRPVWGLQFHPEYTADIMRSYLTHQADHLRKTGKNYEQLAQKVEDTPLSASLLKQFARIALGHGTTGDTGNTGDTDDL